MAASGKYPDELRKRATRMAVELRADLATKQGAIARVAEQLGVHPETLRGWVRQAEIDGGLRSGTPTAEAERIAKQEQEVRELQRANHHLKTSAAFSRRSSTAPPAGSGLHRRPSPRGGRRAPGRDRADLCCAEEGWRADRPEQLLRGQDRPPSARAIRDAELATGIRVAHKANLDVYGASKIYAELNRAGVKVARCTVKWLMRAQMRRGIARGKTCRTTTGDAGTGQPEDL